MLLIRNNCLPRPDQLVASARYFPGKFQVRRNRIEPGDLLLYGFDHFSPSGMTFVRHLQGFP